MSIPMSTAKPIVPQLTAHETPSKRVDIELIEAVQAVIEDPSPRGCLAVKAMAEERKAKLTLPPVCAEYMKRQKDILIPPVDGPSADGGSAEDDRVPTPVQRKAPTKPEKITKPIKP